METKKCLICNITKNLSEFHKDKSKIDGLNIYCKECRKLKLQNFYLNNKTKINNRNKNYRDLNLSKVLEIEKISRNKNKEIIKEKRKINKPKHKEYCRLNKDKIKKQASIYQKNKRENDEIFKLKGNIRTLITKSFKEINENKNSKTEIILGCTFEEFKTHLESKFKPWMDWDNYGNPKDGIFELNKTWDIDHIIPLSTAKTKADIIRLNHYTNLQPLCSFTNRWIKINK